MAAFPYFILAIFTTVATINGNPNYLYYTAPGGATYGEIPGLYGASAKLSQNGKALGFPDSGVQCLNTEKGLKRGFTMRSVSYDPRSRKVLMNVNHEGHSRSVTLGVINLCLAQEECENATVSPLLLFDNAQVDSIMYPFAYYDSQTYFLATTEKDAPNDMTKRTIELRKLNGCRKKYPVKIYTSFDISECSKKIATIAEATYDGANSVSPISVSNTLYVINTGYETFFLTQIQKVEYDEDVVATSYIMELLLVKGSSGEVSSLYKESVDTEFEQYQMMDIGAISLKNKKLCWSAIDTILCADWSNSGSISNIRAVLPKGESQKACLTMPGDDIAPRLVTGIAVAQTEGELAIYFGCIAKTSGYGGAGLLKVKGNGQRHIYNLSVNDTEIYAGSMFLVSECIPEKAIPPPQGGEGYWLATATTNLPSMILTCVIIPLILSLT